LESLLIFTTDTPLSIALRKVGTAISASAPNALSLSQTEGFFVYPSGQYVVAITLDVNANVLSNQFPNVFGQVYTQLLQACVNGRL